MSKIKTPADAAKILSSATQAGALELIKRFYFSTNNIMITDDGQVINKALGHYLGNLETNRAKTKFTYMAFQKRLNIDISDYLNTTEYVIWGVMPGKSDEQLLITVDQGRNKITRPVEAERLKKWCIDNGATGVRIQTINLVDNNLFKNIYK